MKKIIQTKKNLLFIAFLLLFITVITITGYPSVVKAVNGWQTSGSNIYYNNSGGQVGIGTTAPQREMHIQSANGAQILLTGTGSVDWEGIEWKRGLLQGYTGMLDSDGRFFVDMGSNGEDFTIKQNGYIGIGISNPLRKLHISSNAPEIQFTDTDQSKNWHIGGYGNNFAITETNVAIRMTFNAGGSVSVPGTFTAGSYACSSDLRFKKDIKPLDNSLKKLMGLEGISYYWKTDEFKDRAWPKTQQIGLIAQDVEKILPQVVITNPDGYKSVDYDKLSAVIINAVKEQQAEIAGLKKQNQELKQELDILKNKIGY